MDYPLPERDDTASRLLGLFDTPAYVRRGIQLAEAKDRLFHRCAVQRDHWLRGCAFHVKHLVQLLASWHDLRPFLASADDEEIVINMAACLAPHVPFVRSTRANAWTIHSAIRSLIESVGRFNRRWELFVARLDLSDVNTRVAGYNRYYLIEKECAMGSVRLAARGFKPEVEFTQQQILDHFPLLPVPRLA